jgi:hypothetical protein
MEELNKGVYRRIQQPEIDPSRPTQRHNYNITDFFSNYEEISKIPGHTDHVLAENEEGKRNRTCLRVISDYFMLRNPSIWIFLMLMAFITTIIAISVEFVVKYITHLKIEW